MDSAADVRTARGRNWSPHYIVVGPSAPGTCRVEIWGVFNNLIKEGTMALNPASANAWGEALHLSDGDRHLARRILDAVGEVRFAAIARAACS